MIPFNKGLYTSTAKYNIDKIQLQKIKLREKISKTQQEEISFIEPRNKHTK